MNDGKLIVQEPKPRAGRRRVAYPREIANELRWHLERYAEPGGGGLIRPAVQPLFSPVPSAVTNMATHQLAVDTLFK